MDPKLQEIIARFYGDLAQWPVESASDEEWLADLIRAIRDELDNIEQGIA